MIFPEKPVKPPPVFSVRKGQMKDILIRNRTRLNNSILGRIIDRKELYVPKWCDEPLTYEAEDGDVVFKMNYQEDDKTEVWMFEEVNYAEREEQLPS